MSKNLEQIKSKYEDDSNHEILEKIIDSCNDLIKNHQLPNKDEYLDELDSSIHELLANICENDTLNTNSNDGINETIDSIKNDNKNYTESNQLPPKRIPTPTKQLPTKQLPTKRLTQTNQPTNSYSNQSMEQPTDNALKKREDDSNSLKTLEDYKNLIDEIQNSAEDDYNHDYLNSGIDDKLESYKALDCNKRISGKLPEESVQNNKNQIQNQKSSNSNTLKYGLICGGIGLIVILIIVLLMLKKKGKKNKKNSEAINISLQDDEDDSDIKITPVKPNNIQKTTLKSEPISLNELHNNILPGKKDNSNSSITSLNSKNINQSANVSVVTNHDIINNNNSFTNSPKLRSINPINDTMVLNNIRSDSPMMRNAVPNYASSSLPSPPLQSPPLPSAPMAATPIYSPQMIPQPMQSPVIQSQPTPLNYNNINKNNYNYRNSPNLENPVSGNIPADNFQNISSINNSGYQIPSPPLVPIVSSLASNENPRSSISSVSTLQNKDTTEVTQETNKGTLPSYIDTLSQKVQPNEHVFIAQYYYNPKFNDEFQISPGDVISFGQSTYDDGWAHGKNLTKDTTGVFPLGVVIKVVDANGNNRDPYQLSEKYRCKPRSSSHTVKYQASTSENDPKFEKSSLDLNFLLGKLNVEEYLYLNNIERKKLENKANALKLNTNNNNNKALNSNLNINVAPNSNINIIINQNAGASGSASASGSSSGNASASGSGSANASGSASGNASGSASGNASGSASGNASGSGSANASGSGSANSSGSASDNVSGSADGNASGSSSNNAQSSN